MKKISYITYDWKHKSKDGLLLDVANKLNEVIAAINDLIPYGPGLSEDSPESEKNP